MEIECNAYRVREGSKDEFVAVGSDGNILRWGESSGSEQEWVILPVGKNRYRFLTCQETTRDQNKCMAVGSNGNILRWDKTDGKEQEFSFVNEDENGWCNIQEHSRDNYVAVGSNGNILSWSWTGGNEQKFKLELGSTSPVPPVVQQGAYEPGMIPDVPRLEGFTRPPKTSDYYLIGEVVFPAFFVEDPNYRSKVTQVKANPYYTLRREQFWHSQYYKEFDGKTEETHEIIITYGTKNVVSESMESSIGMKVTAGLEMAYNPELEVEGIKIKGVNSGKQSVSVEVSASLKITQTNEKTEYEETVKKDTLKISAGKRFAKAIWLLCDRYTVIDGKGSTIGQWEILRDDTRVDDSYPKD